MPKINTRPSLKAGLFGDTVRGWDVLAHQIRMIAHSALESVIVGVAIASIVVVTYTLIVTSPTDRHYAFVYTQARAWCLASSCGHVVGFTAPDGRKLTASALQLAESKGIRAGAARVLRAAGTGLLLGFAATVAFLIFVVRRARRHGEELRQDNFLRGGRLEDAPELAKQLRAAGAASDLVVGDLPLLVGSETSHILLLGSTGTGKTVVISQLLDQIRKRGERAVIVDVGGDLMARMHQAGDTILDPLDSRSVAWSPFGELRSAAETDELSRSIIPDGRGHDAEWNRYSQVLASCVLRRLIERGQATNERLVYYLTIAKPKELEQIVVGLPAQTLFDEGASKMVSSVRGIIGTYLQPYSYLPPGADASSWSVRSWTESGSGWLWIPYRDNTAAATMPLRRAWTDIVVRSVLSLPADDNRRLWLILDELPAHGPLPQLANAGARGRKYGLCLVLGMQSIGQLREVYGRDIAETIVGIANTQLIYRCPDPDTAEWASRSIGEADTEEADESLSYSAADARDAINLRHSRQVRRLVLPTELMQLPNLRAFAKLSGDYPIARITLTPADRPQVTDPFIAAALVTPANSASRQPAQAAPDSNVLTDLLSPQGANNGRA